MSMLCLMPLNDESGRIEFVGAVMDVTTTKEAEGKIRLIIDTLPALIWTARRGGGLDFISQWSLDYDWCRPQLDL